MASAKARKIFGILAKYNGASNIQEAWELITRSLQEAEILDSSGTLWSIPKIDAPSTKQYGDDGKALRLIGHYIYINYSGAFAIYEITDTISCVFTKPALNGSAFVEVPGYRMPI